MASVARRKHPWHSGTYLVQSRKVRERAAANPATRCWRCGLMLHQCRPHRNGKPARWTAGHVRDSDPTSPLLPECSPCNKSAGAAYGNRLRGARRAVQGAAQEPPTSTSWRW